jgi:hypothetical protein
MRTPAAKANWHAKMSQVGEDGLTGFQRRGQAIKAAKLAKNPDYFKEHGKKIIETLSAVDENGVSGLQKRGRKIAKSVDLNKRGQAISKALREKYQTSEEYKQQLIQYRNRVAFLSRKNDLSALPDYDKWGQGYELDHKYSIKHGFDNGVEPEILAHIFNLRFIPKFDNVSKGRKSVISLQELREVASS